MSPPPTPPLRSVPWQTSEVRGLLRLAVSGTLGVTDLVEAVHQRIAWGIAPRLGLVPSTPTPGRASGITGAVYRAVRGGTRWVGRGADAALGQLETHASGAAGGADSRSDALRAVLNGVFGDHLADSANPLAIRMALRQAGVALDLEGAPLSTQLAEPRRKLLVLAHGLCMNDRQWSRGGHDHGLALARDLGFTPIYLHYNSGRHVADNGRDFSELLERLLARWPVPLEQLVIVGHSMGGLVARSACHHAAGHGQRWLRSLDKLVCLGTPHHGAPLERGGRWLDVLLGLSPYAAPFARLGKARSAGITDLRFGNVQGNVANGHDRHAQQRDDRPPTPLPDGVRTYLLAATTTDKPGRLHQALIGDGLVPLASALGEHRDAEFALRVPDAQRRVVASCGHLELLSHAEVYAQLRRWLGQS